MTVKHLRRHMLICDGGCGATLGEEANIEGPVVIREVAVSLGWQMLPRVRSDGSPARPYDPERNGRNWPGHDICPACVPSFTPTKMARPTGRKPWAFEQIERLEAEIRALKGQV